MTHGRESILVGSSLVAEGSVNSLLISQQIRKLGQGRKQGSAGVLDNVGGQRELSSQLCSSLSAS